MTENRIPRMRMRGKSHIISYYDSKGIRRTKSAGQSKIVADRMLAKYADWFLDGKDPEAELRSLYEKNVRGAIKVCEFFDIFYDMHGSTVSESMRISYRNSMKHVARCESLYHCEVQNIKKTDVRTYLDLRLKEGSKTSSVNREGTFLKCMITKAFQWEYINTNLLDGLVLYKENNQRDVNISLERISELLSELPPQIEDIVEFALATGLRKRNVLDMKIESILFDREQVSAYLTTKGGKKQNIFFNAIAQMVIQRNLNSRRTGFLFINPKTGTRYFDVKKSFKKAVRKLELKALDGSYLRFHDLRHLHSLYNLHVGVSRDNIGILLGHRDKKSTDRYLNFDYLAVKSSLERFPELRQRQKGLKLIKTS